MRIEADIKLALANYRAIADAPPITELMAGIDAETATAWTDVVTRAKYCADMLAWTLEGPPIATELPDMETMRKRLREWPGKWDDLGNVSAAEREFLTYITAAVPEKRPFTGFPPTPLKRNRVG